MAKSKGTQLRRLDAELVKRKIARSREHAREMILDGRVSVNGMEAKKPATGVDGEVSIRVTESDDDRWASRGAHKLLGALAAFEPQGLDLAGTRVLDAGASTGGFTDVCLDRGVSEVLAVDVGYGQLIWRLQNDPRVTVLDRTNVRTLTPEQLDQLKVLSGTSNPDNSLTRALRDIRLTLCRVGEQEYYKVTGLSQNGGNPVEIYIDKNDFLIRRIKAVFQIGSRSLRYDSTIQRYSLYEGVMIPAETTVVQNGLKQTTRVVYYKLDAVIPASDFRPPVL